MNVLFVCTGNTCRSPMAEAIMKEKLPQVNVKSAGIFAHENDTANPNAIKALQEKGITLVHSAQVVTEEVIDWAHIVLTMTDAHRQLLIGTYPQAEKKIHTLIEFTTSNESNEVGVSLNKDIVDPFGGSLDMYKKTLSEIEHYIDHVVTKIEG